MSALAHQVTKFHQWAEASGLQPGCCGEWECDYPEWQDFYAVVGSFLETAARRTLTADELELLLYTLARDNEDEVVLQRLEKFPAVALQVVQAAVSFPDTDARWQAAVLAGQIGAAAIVRRFLDDEDEYVRRRAGFALQEMESKA